VVAAVLAAYTLGLLAHASVKLFASGFYALGDTRTPVLIAAGAVALSAGTGAALMQVLGPAGIAAGAALGAWVNLGLLVRALERRVGPIVTANDRRPLLAVLAGSTLGAAAAAATVGALAATPLPVQCGTGLLAFGVAYGGITAGLGHPEARRLLGAWRRRAAAHDQ
jgi:putative peptidoglycan lipid II flippase